MPLLDFAQDSLKILSDRDFAFAVVGNCNQYLE